MGQINTKIETMLSTLASIIFPAPFIFTIPLELLIYITSLMDIKSQSALSRACKSLNMCYKETESTIFCNSQKGHLYLPTIHELHRRLSHCGWNYFNLILISDSVDYQEIAKSPRNYLYLEENFEMLDNLMHINFLTVMLTSTLRNPTPSSSFFENSNLKDLSSLIIFGLEVMNGLEPVFSKLPLRFISLTHCDMRKCDLSTMFVNHPNVKEFCLKGCIYSDNSRLQFPANLEMLETGQYNKSNIIDISRCKQLKNLRLNATKTKKEHPVTINISELEHLRTFAPECNLTDFKLFNDSFANVEVLFLEWDRILKYETIGSSPIKNLEDKNRHLDFSPLKKCSIKTLCILNIDPKYTMNITTPLGTHVLAVECTWLGDGTCPPQTLYFQLDPHKSIKRCLPFKIPQIDEMFLIGQ
jgi:hypothetical protein